VIASCTFSRLLAVCWPSAQSARDNHVLACNLAKYSPILIFFSLAVPHFKYAARFTAVLADRGRRFIFLMYFVMLLSIFFGVLPRLLPYLTLKFLRGR